MNLSRHADSCEVLIQIGVAGKLFNEQITYWRGGTESSAIDSPLEVPHQAFGPLPPDKVGVTEDTALHARRSK